MLVYAAHGEIGETAKLSGTICNGTGSGSAGHATWPFPDTDSAIDYSETHYKRTPLAKPESPFTVARACNSSGPSSLTQLWLDLTRYAGAYGPLSTRVGAATLTDHGAQMEASTTTGH